ncbi:hypothetical protein RUND412_008463 [Rhizina undulata]
MLGVRSICTLLLATTFMGLSGAQNSATASATASATSSAASGAVTHVVSVAKANFQFTPNTINASIGDIIRFEFYPVNHSVVRMDYNSPCVPYGLVNPGYTGWIWSGFMPVAQFLNPAPSWELTIDTLEPQPFYCSAPDACNGEQMVGIINPNASTPIAALIKAASQASYDLSPGESFPTEGTSTSSSSSSSSASNTSHGVTLSTGAIAGIAIGGAAALALFGLLFFFVGRKKAEPTANASAAQEAGLMNGVDHPPVYDPRYSMTSPEWEQGKTPGVVADGGFFASGDNGGMNRLGSPRLEDYNPDASATDAANPHRISELGAENYGPAELYAPGPELVTEGHVAGTNHENS